MDGIQTFHRTVEIPYKNDYIIELGTMNNIDELEKLYNDLNDFLESGTNYAGWKKGVYPIRETAVSGIENNNLFVLKVNNEIAGSIILNHKQESAYSQVNWGIEAAPKEIIVIHTLVVNPKYIKNGIGKKLMDFVKKYGVERGIKTIRLDVSIHNTPAISLYEKCGYKYVGTVDLGLNIPELVWFRLYELVL
jgi:ribosomal protein S18 acetylase RimI-like enzyme